MVAIKDGLTSTREILEAHGTGPLANVNTVSGLVAWLSSP